tara:strand:+ start:29267 stop:29572 length:306 start_codon:yes stop_codon:yes gene_type:complete
MSIDYNAIGGVGYKVLDSGQAEEDYDNDFHWMVESLIGAGFSVEATGSLLHGALEYYVFIDEPFSEGLNLSNKKISLDNELERIGIRSTGEFRAHWDLLIS